MAGRRYDYDSRSEYRRSDVGRGDERIWDEEPDYRSRAPARARATTTIIKERDRSPPDFLQDYRRPAGPLVLRKEDIEFAPPSRRHRSPSPVERKVDEIILRKDPDIRREPPPSRDREEIIIRRGEREPDRPRSPPPREVEEFILRREERGGGNQRYSAVPNKDMTERWQPRRDYDRDEIIIRRDREESPEPPEPRYRRRDDPYALPRAVSHERERERHERERSRVSRSRAGSETDEIIIRRDEREVGRNGREREREEIIIRRHDSRSPSPVSTPAPSVLPPPDPPVIKGPTIHQDVILHHKHIDHGYVPAPIDTYVPAPIAPPARAPVRARPPTPDSPPRGEDERIEIHRHGERNGKAYEEDIIIDRNQSKSTPPVRDRHDEPYYGSPPPQRRPAPPPERWRDPRDTRDIQEEAEYYNQRALERSYPGEGYHGATKDWAIVDVPPGTRRVRMDGAGGGAQEITWQRYNGVRRSKFMPDGFDEGYGSEVGRPAPAPPTVGEIGRRYAGAKDFKDGLWTEITKDLVVKEAIVEAGYEFEETDDFFYIIAYLTYEDVARLVGLSEDIRRARRKRMKEIDWERRILPPPEAPRRPLAIEDKPSRTGPSHWDYEDERVVEREWYRPRAPHPRR